MPSPFPGMDPYLESHWRDVHHRLITYASDAIQETLPAELRARVEERVVPGLTASMHAERLTEGYIEIIAAGSGYRVVTIIEVLSPTSKTPGEGLIEYKRKQREITQSKTNLVEINLLRTGKHVLAVPLESIPESLRTPYMVCILRATDHGRAEVYPVPLAQPLPIVKVPLRPGDVDVMLDLQALIEECYRKRRYEGDLDYGRDADPPLTGPDAEWAAELLRNKGFRPEL